MSGTLGTADRPSRRRDHRCAGGGALQDQPVELRRASPTSALKKQAGLSPDELEIVDKNVPFGIPKKDTKWPHGPTHYIVREGYVLEHSTTDKIPLWVCEGVTAEQLTGNADRSDGFAPDPLLPVGERAELRDYRGSGYDRGHMAPAGDQKSSQARQDETFLLSNMSPQLAALNRKVWKQLEERVREWVKGRGFAFVITGGFFYDSSEDSEATADGSIDYFIIGPGSVAVPTHFYKIVVAKNASGRWGAIAFVLENRGYTKPYEFEDDIVSIDWLEEHTDLNFMPDLDPDQEHELEASPGAMW